MPAVSVDAPDPGSNAHKDWIVTTGMKNPEAYHHKLMRKKYPIKHTHLRNCWLVTSCYIFGLLFRECV